MFKGKAGWKPGLGARLEPATIKSSAGILFFWGRAPALVAAADGRII
jgi:hypothetical protein